MPYFDDLHKHIRLGQGLVDTKMEKFAAHDQVVIPNHEESGDEDWGLPFLPNFGIDNY